MAVDLLQRKRTHFVLWSPQTATPPALVIGQLQETAPPTLAGRRELPLTAVAGKPGLWEIAAASCNLQPGELYHYWFLVEDTRPGSAGQRAQCSDPFGHCVDYRLEEPDNQPATVVRFVNGELVPADPGPEPASVPPPAPEPSIASLPTNMQLVIYELPSAWTARQGDGPLERGVGTFRDVRALIEKSADGGTFSGLAVTAAGRSYLTELGINALELLPPADSNVFREWGYGTGHYFAPDYELGLPFGQTFPTSLADLDMLSRSCHAHGIRLFADVVMGYGREEPYRTIANAQFYLEHPDADPSDPDALQSGRGDGSRRTPREGFGGTPFRYAWFVSTYDPISGSVKSLSPARQLHFCHASRWLEDFRLDGLRLDSIENVANWDFVREFKDHAREQFRARGASQGLSKGAADARFLVIGEELTLPMDLLSQGRLDSLWNDAFRARVRAAILGESADRGTRFEDSLRQAIDCRNLGFQDGSQAINYLTSHDVQDFRKERLFTMLRHLPEEERLRRIRLAFVCLLTAVGIPMFLAGEEFADQHDLFDEHGNVTQEGHKQADPVNFSRLEGDPRRQELLRYVARLVHFRTSHPAFGQNHCPFLHVDFSHGKRVLVWQRGGDRTGADPVVVVANFSDFGTEGGPNAEYVVPHWPTTPAGRSWREVSQDRSVPPDWVAREPIFPWEAKVYTLA